MKTRVLLSALIVAMFIGTAPVMARTIALLKFDPNASNGRVALCANPDWLNEEIGPINWDPGIDPNDPNLGNYAPGGANYGLSQIMDNSPEYQAGQGLLNYNMEGGRYGHFLRQDEFGRSFYNHGFWNDRSTSPVDPNVVRPRRGFSHSAFDPCVGSMVPAAGGILDAPLTDWTLEAWIYDNGKDEWDNYNSRSENIVVNIGRVWDAWDCMTIHYDGNYGSIRGRFKPDASGKAYGVEATKAFPFKWNHIALVYDHKEVGEDPADPCGTLKLYIDGFCWADVKDAVDAGTFPSDPNVWPRTLQLASDQFGPAWMSTRKAIPAGETLLFNYNPALEPDDPNQQRIAPYLGFGGYYNHQSSTYVCDVRLSDEVIVPSFDINLADPNVPGTIHDSRSGWWGAIDGTPLVEDVIQDNVVNEKDLTEIVWDWLGCTDPTDPACSPAYTYPMFPMASAKTINGIHAAGEWPTFPGDQWYRLDVVIDDPCYSARGYHPAESAINSAFYCAEWDDGGTPGDATDDAIYVAVRVDDSDPCLLPFNYWNTQDCVEVYFQAAGNGQKFLTNMSNGQKFSIGNDGGGNTPGNMYAYWEHNDPMTDVGGGLNPGIVQAYAVQYNAPDLAYEIKLTPYSSYVKNGASGTLKELAVGEQVAVEVGLILQGDNPEDGHGHDYWNYEEAPYYAGLLAENTRSGKFNNDPTDAVSVFTLVPAAGTGSVGDWGYHIGDIDEDGDVNLLDFGRMVGKWMESY